MYLIERGNQILKKTSPNTSTRGLNVELVCYLDEIKMFKKLVHKHGFPNPSEPLPNVRTHKALASSPRMGTTASPRMGTSASPRMGNHPLKKLNVR